jgi:hypothetical protein
MPAQISSGAKSQQIDPRLMERVHDTRGRDRHDRVSVGWRSRRDFERNAASGAGTIVDDEVLCLTDSL